MKSSHKSASNDAGRHTSKRPLAKINILSRQIDSLRVVMRRMKTAPSASLDSLISKKLGEL